jgi:alkylation response protein AidB-like acyl-CoA dehydrogenase
VTFSSPFLNLPGSSANLSPKISSSSIYAADAFWCASAPLSAQLRLSELLLSLPVKGLPGRLNFCTAAEGQGNRVDLALTDEQQHLRKSVREFAENEIRPHVQEWDEAASFPREIISGLGELGVLGAIFPESLGGAGLGYVELTVAVEEIARVDASVALSASAHTSLAANHIYQSGSDAQRNRFLPPLIAGQKLGCWCLTEPEAGSDAAGTRTRAERSGEGWLLNGTKSFITNGSYADTCVILAVTTPSLAHHGISAFIVERGTPGFRSGKKERKLGMCASDTAEVILEDCLIPGENLVGEEGEGFVDALHILDKGRISIAALAVGIAQGAFEAALDYSQQRRQFGQAISEFEGIQWKLADMATQIEAARLLTLQAAWMKDKGLRITKAASMAKLFASETAVQVAGEALQIHGGYGFVKDYPVEKFYRDVKLCTIGEGTSEIQRLVIARQLLHGDE